VQVGDLVKYKYAQEDIGIIIETDKSSLPPKFKVAWVGDGFNDWMLAAGLRVINANR